MMMGRNRHHRHRAHTTPAAQVVPTGWPVFSLGWGGRQHMLVAGGNSVLHIFRLEMADVLRAKHAAASMHGHGLTGATSGGACGASGGAVLRWRR